MKNGALGRRFCLRESQYPLQRAMVQGAGDNGERPGVNACALPAIAGIGRERAGRGHARVG